MFLHKRNNSKILNNSHYEQVTFSNYYNLSKSKALVIITNLKIQFDFQEGNLQLPQQGQRPQWGLACTEDSWIMGNVIAPLSGLENFVRKLCQLFSALISQFLLLPFHSIFIFIGKVTYWRLVLQNFRFSYNFDAKHL